MIIKTLKDWGICVDGSFCENPPIPLWVTGKITLNSESRIGIVHACMQACIYIFMTMKFGLQVKMGHDMINQYLYLQTLNHQFIFPARLSLGA